MASYFHRCRRHGNSDIEWDETVAIQKGGEGDEARKKWCMNELSIVILYVLHI